MLPNSAMIIVILKKYMYLKARTVHTIFPRVIFPVTDCSRAGLCIPVRYQIQALLGAAK